MTQPPYSPAQAQQAQPVYVTRPTNVLAIVALVTSLVGFAIVPVICGHLALGQIKRTGEGGNALAIVGLVLGYLQIVGYAVLAVVLLGGGVAIWSQS